MPPTPPCSPLAVLLGGEIELEIFLHVHHVEEAAPFVALADAGGRRPHPIPSVLGLMLPTGRAEGLRAHRGILGPVSEGTGDTLT